MSILVHLHTITRLVMPSMRSDFQEYRKVSRLGGATQLCIEADFTL